MALIMIQGFDAGIPVGCGGAGCYPWQVSPLIGTLGVNVSVVSSPVRTGTGALRIFTTGVLNAALSMGTYDATTGQQSGFNLTEFWGRFYFQYATKSTAATGELLMSFRTAGNVRAAQIILPSSGILRIEGAGTATADGTTVLAANTWYEIEWHYLAGVGGQFELKLNGVTEVTLNANFNVNQIADIYVGRQVNFNNTAVDYFYDDMVVSNSAYPGPGRVIDLRPNAAGTYADWTAGPVPQDYTQIDDVPILQINPILTYIANSGAATNQVSTFLMTNPVTAGITGKVKAVVPWLLAREDVNGTSNQKIRFRVNGTNFDSLVFDVNTNYQAMGKIYVTNPSTGLNWKRADLITAEAGPLQANAIAMRCTAVGLTVAYNDEEPGDGQPLLALLGAGS